MEHILLPIFIALSTFQPTQKNTSRNRKNKPQQIDYIKIFNYKFLVEGPTEDRTSVPWYAKLLSWLHNQGDEFENNKLASWSFAVHWTVFRFESLSCENVGLK